MARAHKELRWDMDGSESFMSSGHEVKKMRLVKHQIPSWARSDARIREFVSKAFPNVGKKSKDRQAAARWVRLIHLYFRLHWMRSQIAAEMNLSYSAVHSMIRNIKRSADGLVANGNGIRKKSGSGRPKKSCPTSGPFGSHDQNGDKER